MTKSPTSKVAAKASSTDNKPSLKVAPERATLTHRKQAPNNAAEEVSDSNRKALAEIRASELPDSVNAPPERNVVRQFGAPQVQFSMRALAGKTAPTDSADLHAEVPASMRGLFETNVASTRALYQHSVNAFQTAFESWESSFDAARQGAMALNHKVIDISERNISSGFDLATRLLASKTLAEALEVQTAYWGRQLGEPRMQAEEVRVLLEKVTSTAAEPIKAQGMRDIKAN